MKKLFLILTLLFASYTANAQVTVKVDLSVFRYNDSLNILEVYYAFPDNCIKLLHDGDLKRGSIGFAIGVISDGEIVDSVQWIQEINIPAENKDYVSDLVGLKTILVPFGEYTLKFIALDMFDRNSRDIREIDFKSERYSKEVISASDLQIAAAIDPESKPTQKWNPSFLKNSLYVIPNPGRDVLGSSPEINSYIEIYNAKTLSADGLNVTYIVENAGNREVFRINREKKAYSDAMVEYISIPVGALPTGVYYFTIKVEPVSGTETSAVVKKKKIYVSNYEIPPTAIDEFYENLPFERSEFATMTEEQVETSFEQIQYITSDYEKDVWDKCQTIGAKQRFLYTFWQSRNTDTTKPYNQALEEYRVRIQYANKHFRFGLNKEGWRTERGRVYLQYGPPSEIESHVRVGEEPAYDKWMYHDYQGGIEFVFVDFLSNGRYQLVHSNAMGEAQNPNWYEQYIQKQDPDPNFQYQKRNW